MTAGSCPGSGLRPTQESGPSPAECVTACLDTAAGRGTCRSLARAKPGCCCCWACWRPTSQGGGRRPAPRSSSSWWIGGPCLCCCRRGGGSRGVGESRTTNKEAMYLGSTLIYPPFITMQAQQWMCLPLQYHEWPLPAHLNGSSRCSPVLGHIYDLQPVAHRYNTATYCIVFTLDVTALM